MAVFHYTLLIILIHVLTLYVPCFGSDSCLDHPCHNGGTCDDTSGQAVCTCDVMFVGECCDYVTDNLSNSSSCMASSSEWAIGFGCENALDGIISPGIDNEWVTDADGIGAFIIIDLGELSDVLGVKLLQRCESGHQAKDIAVSPTDGSVFLESLECEATPDCTESKWFTLLFSETKHQTSLIKIVVMDVCGTNISTNVGFREILVMGPVAECLDSPCENNATCKEKDLGYHCECLVGFEGQNCEINIDDCSDVDCNHGHCIDGIDDWDCDCDAGYEGINCEIDIDDCSDVDCNHGDCIDGIDDWDCDCDPGYEGTNCEIDIDDCSDVDCNHGDCIDGIADWDCDCDPGYEGINCEIDIDDCVGVNCTNGSCVDDVDAWHCDCDPGFKGTNCEINIDDCVGVNCTNGSCADDVDAWHCDCVPGFDGTNCEINIDDCDGIVCNNGGTCVDLIDDFICECQPGYDGLFCDVDTSVCIPDPCLNSMSCDNTTGIPQCICLQGYNGNQCEININECETVTCEHDGICIDGVDCFHCECPFGYAGMYCEQDSSCAMVRKRQKCGLKGINRTECENLGCCYDNSIPKLIACYQKLDNPCDFIRCQHGGTCLKISQDSYICDCAEGWAGIHCEIGIATFTTCNIPAADRENCGYKGISKDTCSSYGCCWHPIKDYHWCFYPQEL